MVMVSGSVKVALYPLHVWLGKVHGECSTVGSVLLAGVGLKLGYWLHVLGMYGTLWW
jgi:NADH:ubiquinone oxidoreductase subunit 4 (subunit M)